MDDERRMMMMAVGGGDDDAWDEMLEEMMMNWMKEDKKIKYKCVNLNLSGHNAHVYSPATTITITTSIIIIHHHSIAQHSTGRHCLFNATKPYTTQNNYFCRSYKNKKSSAPTNQPTNHSTYLAQSCLGLGQPSSNMYDALLLFLCLLKGRIRFKLGFVWFGFLKFLIHKK